MNGHLRGPRARLMRARRTGHHLLTLHGCWLASNHARCSPWGETHAGCHRDAPRARSHRDPSRPYTRTSHKPHRESP